MDKVTLGSCPFCGDDSEVSYYEADGDFGDRDFRYIVECGACFGTMRSISKAKAFEEWNRRTDSKLNALLEAVRVLVDRIETGSNFCDEFTNTKDALAAFAPDTGTDTDAQAAEGEVGTNGIRREN